MAMTNEEKYLNYPFNSDIRLNQRDKPFDHVDNFTRDSIHWNASLDTGIELRVA